MFDRFDAGLTIGGVLPELGETADLTAIQRAVEAAVLDLLAGDEDSDHVEQLVSELEKLAA